MSADPIAESVVVRHSDLKRLLDEYVDPSWIADEDLPILYRLKDALIDGEVSGA